MAVDHSERIHPKIQLALAEVESLVREGHANSCETVFHRYPELLDDTEAFLELLYTEHLLRQERNEKLSASNWLLRFPNRTEDIENFFRMESYCSVNRSSLSSLEAGRLKQTTKPLNSEDQVGDYELLEKVGQGGMGTVYRARQLTLDRVVCLKISNERWSASNKTRGQLSDEAEIASRLIHPSIVQIYEAGVDDEVPYFSMEFVEGPSLEKILRTGPLTAGSSARLLHRLAIAVDYAHSMGVIHRDIKPANILLAQRSDRVEAIELTVSNGHGQNVLRVEPKITDFGLAKREGGDRNETIPGTIIGTPSYMAPEQTGMTLAQTGPSSDIYALGAVLYECLAGHPPFRAATMLDTLLQVRSKDPIPLHTIQPGVPRDLETICLKCLNKPQEKRYATAHELATDLKRFLERRPIAARPVSFTERTLKWSRRNPARAGLSSH